MIERIAFKFLPLQFSPPPHKSSVQIHSKNSLNIDRGHSNGFADFTS